MQKYQNNVMARNGDAVVGATILITLASSSAPATIYSDSGVTTIANPLNTNANGYFEFYAADGRYNILVNGVAVYTDVLISDSIEIDAEALKKTEAAAEDGATKVGTPEGTVQEALDGRPTSTALAASGGIEKVGGIRDATGAQPWLLDAWIARSTIYAFDFLTEAEIAAVKAGTAGDMRAKLQQAIDAAEGKRLVINSGAWKMLPLANGSPTFGLCLDIPSNSMIEFEPGAEIQLLAHNHTIYQMMRVWDSTNVTITRANLNGRKDLNSAVTGEFGMGIDIRGGSVRLEYPTTTNMWGDGIYLAESTVSGNPKNVYILGHVADGCRRQGMSVVGVGGGLTVDSPTWKNIGGVAPGAGLDIEPNSNDSDLTAIRIINPVTENCTGPGILIALQLLAGAVPKTVDIVIEKHRDTGSVVGFSAGLANTSGGTYVMNGSIVSIDPVWVNSQRMAFLSAEHDLRGPLIHLVRPKVVDSNRGVMTSPAYGSPFVVLRDTGSLNTYPIGNVQITEPSVTINTGSIPKLFYFRDVVNGVNFLGKVNFENPRQILGVANNNGGFFGTGKLSDKFAQLGNEVTSTSSDYGSYGGLVAANSSVAFTLSPTLYIAGGPDFTVRQPYATSCIVATGGTSPGTGNFVGQAVGKRLQATGMPGAYLVLRPLGNNVFMIVENVGPWAVI